MRKIIVSEFITLDGVFSDPGGAEGTKNGGWSFPFWHEDIAKFKFEELFAGDALLLGRRTYDGFAAAWPAMADDAGFADRMNSIPKYVVTQSDAGLTWNNSQSIRDDAAQKVTELKQAAGQDILVFGSGQLVNFLTGHGLVDEFRLLVYPVVLGDGQRLFSGEGKRTLRLAETRPFPTGVVLLSYETADITVDQ